MSELPRALLAVIILALSGAANAETRCQTERPTNERTFHCIEMGSKRFRIPDGHLAFWQFPDPKTGRIERFDTMAEEVRGKFTYFFFVSDLPDLTELDFKSIAKKDDISRRLTATVMRQREAPFPLMIETKENQYIFSERLVEYLVSQGYERHGQDPSQPSRLTKGHKSLVLIRGPLGIGELIYDSPREGMYECIHAYAADILVSTGIVGGEAQRNRVCFHGRRVVEKLRSFEY
jgi:hypothetical protein